MKCMKIYDICIPSVILLCPTNCFVRIKQRHEVHKDKIDSVQPLSIVKQSRIHENKALVNSIQGQTCQNQLRNFQGELFQLLNMHLPGATSGNYTNTSNRLYQIDYAINIEIAILILIIFNYSLDPFNLFKELTLSL